jgi:hypothetical protein
VEPALKDRAGQLERLVQQDEADRLLAVRLEEIRMDRAAWVEGSFDYKKAGKEYPRAFAAAGLGVVSGDREGVVPRRHARRAEERSRQDRGGLPLVGGTRKVLFWLATVSPRLIPILDVALDMARGVIQALKQQQEQL